MIDPHDVHADDTDTTVRTAAIVATLAMLVLHGIAAARLEFMFDEAYYSLWARHLAWGYHDHPPGVALWIRLSTSLFGTSEFGVRALGVVATALGALAVYAIALDVLASRTKAALAALLWNAAPLVGIGAILVTPDTPLLVGWTTALWGLGRLFRTADWRWWLVIGVAAGVALEAKYSALFLGAGIALSMITVPGLRRWWLHPAPYVGGLMALAVFAPNIFWNARHGWQTFAKQFGRVADTEWTWRFFVEFLGSQIGFLNPLTFVLVVVGLIHAARTWTSEADATAAGDTVAGGRRLLVAITLPLLLFFLVHSLHDRVQANWTAPLYPTLIILAADAAVTGIASPAWAARLVAAARSRAAPLGLALTAVVYLQAFFALVPLPARTDPTALLSGWGQLGRDLDAVAQREGTAYVLTQGYALTALLKVYCPARLPAYQYPVYQYNERQRWTYEQDPTVPDAARPGLAIVEARRAVAGEFQSRFTSVREVGRIDRRSHGTVLETYIVFRLDGAKGDILDPVPPSMR